MERYSHLQSLPNSPFSPLTPLSENTAFDFNFGGDGSLDVYIDNIRHTHRVEQQQKSSVQTNNEDHTVPRRFSERFLKIRDVFEPQQQQKEFAVPPCKVHLKDPPKKHCCHASNESRLRHTQPPLVHHKDCQMLRQQQQHQPTMHHQQQQPLPASRPTVKITHTGASPHMPKEYMATPKTVRTPLKPKNCNVSLNIQPPLKMNQFQTPQQKQQYRAFLQSHRRASTSNLTQQQHQPFRQASPVAVKPLSPRISKILHHRGLTQYCGLFQRQEIDLFSFKLLQLSDLQQMGVTDPKHCNMILNDICYARQYY